MSCMDKTTDQTNPIEDRKPEYDRPEELMRIEAACRFLEANLDEDPPLDAVARAAHYSPFHFHRLFRGLTGETVRGYARRIRLERSAYRIVHSDDELLNIALDAGYGSHEAFTRAFSKQFGIAPSTYRSEKQDPRPVASTQRLPLSEVRIEKRAPCTLACVRHVGPYSDVGRAWKSLMKWGRAKLVFGKAQTFGLSYDDPDVTDPQHVRYDACMVVKDGTRTKREVLTQPFDGGYFAVTVHEGPYVTLGETYARLFAHIVTHPISGRRWRLGDPPSLEHYLNDPRKTAPEALRTEVMMRVK